MGKVIRQSLFSTIISYIGVALGAFNTLWLIPKAMTTGEIGLYRVIISMAILLVPFAQMGAVQSSIKFFPNYKTQKQRNGFFTLLLLATLGSFLVFMVFFFLLKEPIAGFFEERSPIVGEYLNLVLFLILMMVVFNILESYCRNMLEIIFPNFLKEVQLRLIVSLLVTLYLLGFIGFHQLLFGLVWNYMAAVTFLIFSLLFRYKLRISLSFKSIPLKPIIQYALFSVLGTAGAVIVMQIDSIMISGLLGLDENGIYTTAFFIAVLVEIPRRAISQISLPLISKAFHEDQVSEVKRIYKSSSINLMLAGSLIYLLLVANLDNIFYLIPDWQRFEAGKIVVLIIGAIKLIDIGSGVNTEVIIMSKYYKFNILAISILAILTIITNLILIPKYGLSGAAYATAISIALFNLLKFLFIWIKLKLQPFSLKSLGVIVLLILLLAGIPYLPKLPGVIPEIFLHSLILTVLFLGISFALKISSEMNGMVHKVLARFKS